MRLPRWTTAFPALVLTAALVGGLAGCSSSGDGASPVVTGTAPPSVPGTTAGTLPPSTRPTGTTRPLSPGTTRPNLPASTASTTPPPSTEDTPFPAPVPSGVQDCGAWSMSGFPTTMPFNPSIRSCLLEAMESGTHAMGQISVYTVLEGEGSAPVRTTIEVTGTGKARIVIDATRAADRPQEVTTLICTTLRSEPDAPFVSWDNCRKAGGA